MSNLEFAAGKRVVCIHDNFDIDAREFAAGVVAPVKGCVYTIRGIDPPNELDDFVSLWLEEIVNPELPEYYTVVDGQSAEPSWELRNFRPVRETSIDCFTALLEKPPVKQTEDA